MSDNDYNHYKDYNDYNKYSGYNDYRDSELDLDLEQFSELVAYSDTVGDY